MRKGVSDRRRELFGGRGEVEVWNLRQGPAEPFTAVLYCELSAGGTVGRHVQAEFAELVIGLDGHGEAKVDDRIISLASGDVVHLPVGAVLSIENRSTEVPLKYLIVKARAIERDPHA